MTLPLRMHLITRSALRRSLFALIGLLGLASFTRADHYLGADVTYACQGGNTYLITLDLFLDCAGQPFTAQTLSAVSDCGSAYVINELQATFVEEVSHICSGATDSTTCHGGTLPGVMHYRIQQTLGLPPCQRWVLSWNICCRGAAGNLAGAQGIYIESILDNLNNPCDNSPVFTQQDIPTVCAGEPVETNLGISDPDGDRLVYSLIDARFANGTDVYPVTYADNCSGAVPVPGTVIDTATGQISFVPPLIGHYVFVLKADSYGADGHLKGSVVRDFSFLAVACTNTAPQALEDGVSNLTGGALTDIRHIGVCGDQELCFDARFADTDSNDVMTVLTNVDTALPGAQYELSGTDTITAHICWNTAGATVGGHALNFSVQDDACPVVHTQLYSYLITVGAPINAGPDVITCEGVPVQLNAATTEEVVWTVQSGEPILVGSNFSCDSCASPMASPSTTTVYDVTSAAGCSDAITVTVLPPTDPYCMTLGLAENSVAAFSMMPNPTTGTLQVNGGNARSYDVIDAMGRVRSSGSFAATGQRTLVLPEQLAAGPYVLRLFAPDGVMQTVRFELAR